MEGPLCNGAVVVSAGANAPLCALAWCGPAFGIAAASQHLMPRMRKCVPQHTGGRCRHARRDTRGTTLAITARGRVPCPINALDPDGNLIGLTVVQGVLVVRIARRVVFKGQMPISTRTLVHDAVPPSALLLHERNAADRGLSPETLAIAARPAPPRLESREEGEAAREPRRHCRIACAARRWTLHTSRAKTATE